MARYYQSWRSQPQSQFVERPLALMQQRLDERQQERDYLNSQLQGDMQGSFMPGATADEQMFNDMQNGFNTDMGTAREMLQNTDDLDAVSNYISGVRNRYGFSGGTGAGITSNNTSGSPGTSRSSTSTSGGDNLGTGRYEYGTRQDAAIANRAAYWEQSEAIDKLMEDGDMNEADKWYFLDKTVSDYNERMQNNQSGRGEYVNFDRELRVNEDEYIDDLSKGWNSDGGFSQNSNGDFIDVVTNEVIPESDVHDWGVSQIMNNDAIINGWRRDFAYGQHNGTINNTALTTNALARSYNSDIAEAKAQAAAHGQQYTAPTFEEYKAQKLATMDENSLSNIQFNEYINTQADRAATDLATKLGFHKSKVVKYRDPAAELRYTNAAAEFEYNLQNKTTVSYVPSGTSNGATALEVLDAASTDANIATTKAPELQQNYDNAFNAFAGAVFTNTGKSQQLVSAFNTDTGGNVLNWLSNVNSVMYGDKLTDESSRLLVSNPITGNVALGDNARNEYERLNSTNLSDTEWNQVRRTLNESIASINESQSAVRTNNVLLAAANNTQNVIRGNAIDELGGDEFLQAGYHQYLVQTGNEDDLSFEDFSKAYYSNNASSGLLAEVQTAFVAAGTANRDNRYATELTNVFTEMNKIVNNQITNSNYDAGVVSFSVDYDKAGTAYNAYSDRLIQTMNNEGVLSSLVLTDGTFAAQALFEGRGSFDTDKPYSIVDMSEQRDNRGGVSTVLTFKQGDETKTITYYNNVNSEIIGNGHTNLQTDAADACIETISVNRGSANASMPYQSTTGWSQQDNVLATQLGSNNTQTVESSAMIDGVLRGSDGEYTDVNSPVSGNNYRVTNTGNNTVRIDLVLPNGDTMPVTTNPIANQTGVFETIGKQEYVTIATGNFAKNNAYTNTNINEQLNPAN